MSTDKIKEVLDSLGYQLSDRGAYWQTNAIFRNGDNKTAIQIYKNTGVWKDYASATSFMPFKKLVQVTLGTNDKSVIDKYIKEDKIEYYNTSDEINSKITMDEIYPEEDLEKLFPHYDFYNKKGIDSEFLELLKSGLETSGPMYQRFVFPIYNEHGQIHGYSGRDVSPNPKKEGYKERPKWKHQGKKSKWIYPFYVQKDFFSKEITKKDQVILVESIGDMLNLFQNGIKNVLVTFGLEIPPTLLCFLIGLKPSRIILSFNNDSSKKQNRGLNSCIKSYLKLIPYFNNDSIKICIPNKNDFGEMTSDDFNMWNKKLEKFIEKDQTKDVLNMINSLKSEGLLSANILKNVKYIKSHA